MDEPERRADTLADGLRRLLLLYAPLFAVAVGFAGYRVLGYSGMTILGWLPGALSLAVASWFLFQASRLDRLAPAGRRFWRLMGIAALLIAPATKPLTEASLGGRKSGPVLAGAVLLLSIALLLVLWGLLRLPTRSRSRGDWLRLGLDAATVLVCSATFLWQFVLEPISDARADLPRALGLLVLSLLCLLAVLAVVKLILVGTDAVDMLALQSLAGVVVLGAVGSALVPVLQNDRLAGVSDIITTAEGTMVGLAGVVQLRRVRPATVVRRRRRPYSILPYFAVVGVYLLLVANSGDGPVLAGAVAATATVVLRQLLAFRDNDALLGTVREHQRLLHEQATHDALTGLPNRSLFNDTLDEAFHGAAILVDLDDFKTVNDTLGHHVGDGLLVEVGRRLRAAVRPGDLVARLGGDEFAVLLPLADEAAAGEVAERILAELANPVTTHGHLLTVNASVGVAQRPASDDPQLLLRHADIAMYAAKQAGKGQFARYSPSLAGLLATPAQRADELRAAINAGRVELTHEPIARLTDGAEVERRLSARWPSVDVADLTVPLVRWLLTEACRVTPPGRPFTVDVSRSALLAPGFPHDVAGILAAAAVAPASLTLAVPAALAGEDTGEGTGVRGALQELRAIGVGLALDHTGTAHARLDLLVSLPFTRLVLDAALFPTAGPVPATAPFSPDGRFAANASFPADGRFAANAPFPADGRFAADAPFRADHPFSPDSPFSADDLERRRDALVDAVARLVAATGVETVISGVSDPGQVARLRHLGFTLGSGPAVTAVGDLRLSSH
ncbi:diguanylate cyclase domain-containing protein [Dactylosporangium sp. CA-152071]|uniref:diguanylate cyclase domain-containing protein n=1 Tax=Dactylosporangium sp. CA-152071 TaxID=3239933 RepID=UPI003D8AFCD7